MKNWKKNKEKFSSPFVFAIEFIRILAVGLFRIYIKAVLKLIKRLQVFHLLDFIFFPLAVIMLGLSGLGWRGYSIIINDRLNHHTISTDDFLLFFLATSLLLLPAAIKVLWQIEKKKISWACFLAGMSVNSVFYVLTFLHPGRVAPVKSADFTLWFYLFGGILAILWITGIWRMRIPGIFSMPSIRSRS